MSILSWWFHILAVTAVIVSMLSRVAVAQCDTCAPRDDCCSGIGGSCYNNVTSKCCQQSWAAAVCDQNQTCCGYGYQNSAVSFCCPSETPICCNGACCSVDKPLCCGSFCCASNQVCGETSCEASIPITPVAFSLILPVDLSIFNSYTAQLTCGLRFLSVVLNNDNRESMEWNALVVDTTTTAVVCQVFNGSNVYVVPHTEFLVATSYVAITGYTLNSSPCEPLWQVPTTACESANSLTQAGPFVFALCYPSVLVISVETGAVMLSLTKVSNSVMAENAFVVLFVNGTLAAFDLSALKTTWSHSVFVSAADTSCGLVVNASVVAACVISSDVYFSHTVNITSGVVQRVINFGMNSTAGWSLHWASPPTAYFWYANPVWPNGDTATYQLLNMVDGSSLTPITNVQSTERCCSVCCPPLFGGTLCGGVVAEFESATTVGGQCQPGAYDAVSPHPNATFVTLPSGWTGSSVQLPNSGCAFATVESIYGRFSNITFGTINDPSESLLAPIITDKTPHQVQVFAGFVMAVTSDGATINVTGWWQNAQH